MRKESPIINIESDVNELVDILQNDENKLKVQEILDSYKGYSRNELINKTNLLLRHFEESFGKNATRPLILFVSKQKKDITYLFDFIKNDEIKKFLNDLNLKHISYYEGVYPPLPHDWYRVFWTTSLDITHGGLPTLALRILKRNGEIVELEMPFNSCIKLMIYQISQMKAFNDSMIEGPPQLGIGDDLRELQILINDLLNDKKNVNPKNII